MEDFESLKLTEEERNAVAGYSTFEHGAINFLLDFSPDLYERLTTHYQIDLSPDNFKNVIDRIKGIYSAMYKHSYTQNGRMYTYRGTNIKEANQLIDSKVSRRFLSTSIAKKIPKLFINDEGALLNVSMGEDIPRIRIVRDNGDNEEEILIAPYSKVIGVTEYSSQGLGYKAIGISLEKAQYLQLSPEDKQAYLEYLNKNLGNITETIGQYNTLKSNITELEREKSASNEELKELMATKKYLLDNEQIERYNIELKKIEDDIKVYDESIGEKRNEIDEIKASLAEISTKLEGYIQSELRDIELDIDRNVSHEKEAVIEAVRQSKIKQYNDTKKATLDIIDKTSGEVSSMKNDSSLQDRQKRLKEVADTFGIPYSSLLQQNIPPEDLQGVLDNLSETKNNLHDFEITDEMSMDEIGEAISQLEKKKSNIAQVSSELTTCRNVLLKQCDDESKRVKEQIVKQVQSRIKEAKVQTLKGEMQPLIDKKAQLQKAPFAKIIDKFTGKAALRDAQIENYKLKVDVIDSQPQGELKVSKSLADIDALIPTADTETRRELNDMRSKLVSSFGIRKEDYDNYSSLHEKTSQELLPVPQNMTRKQQLNSLNVQNQELLLKRNDNYARGNGSRDIRSDIRQGVQATKPIDMGNKLIGIRVLARGESSQNRMNTLGVKIVGPNERISENKGTI